MNYLILLKRHRIDLCLFVGIHEYHSVTSQSSLFCEKSLFCEEPNERDLIENRNEQTMACFVVFLLSFFNVHLQQRLQRSNNHYVRDVPMPAQHSQRSGNEVYNLMKG